MARKRLRRIPNRGTMEMFVVAGLPPSLHNRAPSMLTQMARSEIKVVALPSSERDGALYPQKLTSGIVQATAGFTIRRRSDGSEQQSVPSSITLLYVPAEDDECLLRCLDFAVLPIPLHDLAARDAKGRQLRHSDEALRAALARAVDSAGPARRNLSLIKERVGRLADGEPLLLPPRNFHLDRDQKIESVFHALRRGERPWTDRIAELSLRFFTRDHLPRLARHKTRRAFQDYRGLIFLSAHPTAFDGATREAEEEALDSERLLRLRGLYRFGAAVPNGFHHDVQFEQGRTLAGVEFECVLIGQVCGHASHANIYMNDFVRIAGKAKI